MLEQNKEAMYQIQYKHMHVHGVCVYVHMRVCVCVLKVLLFGLLWFEMLAIIVIDIFHL